ncbi:MAG: hypothetical protein IPM17_08535 [Verrucomicrobia bacterium]|nr:hypothetical protein [Verrucomicrobiota bacterium]
MTRDAAGRRLALELDQPPQTVVLDRDTGRWLSGPGRGSPTLVFSPEGDRLLRGVGMILFETNAVTEILPADLNGVPQTLEGSGGRAWFAPDGRVLVTGPWGDALRLWSWPELQLRGDLAEAGTVMQAAFHPAGKRLATVTRHGRLQVWDVQTQRRLLERPTHNGGVIWSVAFSPDGRRLATAGNDQTVRLWDPDTLEELRTLRGHQSEVWTAIWTPDGRQLVSAGKDASIRLWEVAHEPPRREWSELAQTPEFSPDERWLAVRQRDGTVMVLDPFTGEARRQVGPALELGGFSADGLTLSLLRSDRVVEWRRLDNGLLVQTAPAPPEPPATTARRLSPSGRWLIHGTEEGTVWVGKMGGGSAARHLVGHRQRVISLEVSPDERRLLSGSLDLTSRLWDLETGQELAVFVGHQMSVSALAFAPDQGVIATGSWDDTARLWDPVGGTPRAVFSGHPGSVHAVAFAPDGRTLAALSGSGELRFWNLAMGREAGVLPGPAGEGTGRLRFSSAGRWLAVVRPGGTLTLLLAPREDTKPEARRLDIAPD